MKANPNEVPIRFWPRATSHCLDCQADLRPRDQHLHLESAICWGGGLGKGSLERRSKIFWNLFAWYGQILDDFGGFWDIWDILRISWVRVAGFWLDGTQLRSSWMNSWTSWTMRLGKERSLLHPAALSWFMLVYHGLSSFIVAPALSTSFWCFFEDSPWREGVSESSFEKQSHGFTTPTPKTFS